MEGYHDNREICCLNLQARYFARISLRCHSLSAALSCRTVGWLMNNEMGKMYLEGLRKTTKRRNSQVSYSTNSYLLPYVSCY
jgi:hypothetical protein